MIGKLFLPRWHDNRGCFVIRGFFALHDSRRGAGATTLV